MAQAKFQGIDETIYCLRGFEACLSARAVQQKLLRKVAAVQAVMEIQFRQRERRQRGEQPAAAGNDNRNHPHNNYHHHQHNYHHDARKLQTEYYRVTAPARNQAIERAALDAREVREAQAQDQQEEAAATASAAFTVSAGASSSTADDMLALKNEFDRLLAINAVGGPLHPTLRSATSGPLRLCKTVPNTA